MMGFYGGGEGNRGMKGREEGGALGEPGDREGRRGRGRVFWGGGVGGQGEE